MACLGVTSGRHVRGGRGSPANHRRMPEEMHCGTAGAPGAAEQFRDLSASRLGNHTPQRGPAEPGTLRETVLRTSLRELLSGIGRLAGLLRPKSPQSTPLRATLGVSGCGIGYEDRINPRTPSMFRSQAAGEGVRSTITGGFRGSRRALTRGGGCGRQRSVCQPCIQLDLARAARPGAGAGEARSGTWVKEEGRAEPVACACSGRPGDGPGGWGDPGDATLVRYYTPAIRDIPEFPVSRRRSRSHESGFSEVVLTTRVSIVSAARGNATARHGFPVFNCFGDAPPRFMMLPEFVSVKARFARIYWRRGQLTRFGSVWVGDIQSSRNGRSECASVWPSAGSGVPSGGSISGELVGPSQHRCHAHAMAAECARVPVSPTSEACAAASGRLLAQAIQGEDHKRLASLPREMRGRGGTRWHETQG
jgi:hypothetical protein